MSEGISNEFLLEDRLTKIRSVTKKYGEENFYISFSGGRDSTVMHYLFDMALPGNQIPSNARTYGNPFMMNTEELVTG